MIGPLARWLSWGLWVAQLSACAASSFGGASSSTAKKNDGNGAGTTVEQPADNLEAPTDGPKGSDVTIPADCGAAGATQAKLLTPSVQNATPGNFLAYELFVTDCQGNRKTVNANSISFDVDARVTGVNTKDPLPYTVKSKDNQLSGLMSYVQGADLFGKQGKQYFHYETDRPFALMTADSSVVIYIQLGGRSMAPFKSSMVANSAQLLTFLRFGEAAAVSQVVQLLGTAK